MTANAFARLARSTPNPAATPHALAGMVTAYTCHMAVMHWAFMDLGDSHADANGRMAAINRSKCLGCSPGGPMHGSINPSWYGANLCSAGATAVPNRAGLNGAVNVGDVLIVARPTMPMHSMVVVQKRSILGRHFIYIRGFNNFGTTGTGIHLQYDNADRDIDRAALWRAAPPVVPPVVGAEVFGNGGGELYVIPYANYSASAAVVFNNCNYAAGVWTYVGP